MRRLLTSTLIAASFAMASPALANSSSKFESSISEPLQHAVKIEVKLSDDLAYRADNRSKRLKDRSNGSSSFNAAFASNSYLGERDLKRLTERLQAKMEKRLMDQGVRVDPNASTVLRITLKDAVPNHPTFKQSSKQPGISSFHSTALGGATFESELIAAGGRSLGTMSYAWYENNLRDAYHGGTWSDAYQAMDRFARKAAKNLS